MSDIVERFRKALAEPHRLARWELAFGFPFAGVDHSQSLSLHLTRRGGEIARRLVTEIPAPYERNDDGDLFVAGGRSIRFYKRRLGLGIRAADYTPPPSDGGVQDAILAAAYGSMRKSISRVVSGRTTDTHFEEPPPRERRGDVGREFLHSLISCRASVRSHVSCYWSESVANPELRLLLVGPREMQIGARMGRPSRFHPLPEGEYLCRADAPTYGFPMYRQELRRWSRSSLWTSQERIITLEAGDRLVAGLSVPDERLCLSDPERAFFNGRGDFPGTRTNVDLILEVERAGTR